MRRWTIRICCALAWLAFAATLALWIESYWHARRVGWVVRQQRSDAATANSYQILSRAGRTEFSRKQLRSEQHAIDDLVAFLPYYERDAGLIWASFPADWAPFPLDDRLPKAMRQTRIGFSRTHVRIALSARAQIDAFAVPHWLLVVAFSITPLISLGYLAIRRRRHRVGCCERCGYDLRASRERCPECGTPVPAELRNQILPNASVDDANVISTGRSEP